MGSNYPTFDGHSIAVEPSKINTMDEVFDNTSGCLQEKIRRVR